MRKSISTLMGGVTLAAALAAGASAGSFRADSDGDVISSTYYKYVDSDGEVISVIYYYAMISGEHRVIGMRFGDGDFMTVDYATGPGGDPIVMEGGPQQVVPVGDTDYRIAQAGQGYVLRAVDGSHKIPLRRAAGVREGVNPQAFGLD